MCGQLVCPSDSDPITRICRVCAKGTKMGRTSGLKIGRIN